MRIPSIDLGRVDYQENSLRLLYYVTSRREVLSCVCVWRDGLRRQSCSLFSVSRYSSRQNKETKISGIVYAKLLRHPRKINPHLSQKRLDRDSSGNCECGGNFSSPQKNEKKEVGETRRYSDCKEEEKLTSGTTDFYEKLRLSDR